MSPRLLLLTGLSITILGTGCQATEPTPVAEPSALPIQADKDLPAKLPPDDPATSTLPAVSAVPATSQSATSQPAETADPQDTLAAFFDAKLASLLADDPAAQIAPTSLPQDDQELVQYVIDALASFRLGLRNPTNLMATRVAPLAELSDRLNAQIPLSLPTVALCKSATQFGVFDPIEPATFPAGKATPVIIYCEVDHFLSRASTDASWDTKLSYEAVLYPDGDHAAPVISKKPTTIIDRCRVRRRDFFLADRLTLPATLPPGRYLLKVTVIDQFANRVAEKTIPVQIASN